MPTLYTKRYVETVLNKADLGSAAPLRTQTIEFRTVAASARRNHVAPDGAGVRNVIATYRYQMIPRKRLWHEGSAMRQWRSAIGAASSKYGEEGPLHRLCEVVGQAPFSRAPHLPPSLGTKDVFVGRLVASKAGATPLRACKSFSSRLSRFGFPSSLARCLTSVRVQIGNNVLSTLGALAPGKTFRAPGYRLTVRISPQFGGFGLRRSFTPSTLTRLAPTSQPGAGVVVSVELGPRLGRQALGTTMFVGRYWREAFTDAARRFVERIAVSPAAIVVHPAHAGIFLRFVTVFDPAKLAHAKLYSFSPAGCNRG